MKPREIRYLIQGTTVQKWHSWAMTKKVELKTKGKKGTLWCLERLGIPQICPTDFCKGAKATQWRKNSLSTDGAGTTGCT